MKDRMPIVARRFAPALRLSGRCVLARPSFSLQSPLGSSSTHGNTLEFIELTSPTRSPSLLRGGGGAGEAAAAATLRSPLARGHSSLTTRQRTAPISLVGNSYYEKRFRGGMQPSEASQQPQCARSPCDAQLPSTSRADRFMPGDIIIRLITSTAPRHLRARRMVDVTGLHTSYYDASEQDERVLATVDEAVATMHLHDGGEVPELRRGEVPVGKLAVLCVYPPPSHQSHPSSSGRSAPVHDGLSLESAMPIENSAEFLLGRHSLFFQSQEESLSVARKVAERCSALAASAAHTGLHIKPIVRDGRLVSLVFSK